MHLTLIKAAAITRPVGSDRVCLLLAVGKPGEGGRAPAVHGALKNVSFVSSRYLLCNHCPFCVDSDKLQTGNRIARKTDIS